MDGSTQSSAASPVRYDVSRLSDDDVYLLNEGSHFRLYEKLGAHFMTGKDGIDGVYFAVFAPNADRVAAIGDFNAWRADAHPLRKRAESGVWEGFVPGVTEGQHYKFLVENESAGVVARKADPYGFFHQTFPGTASVVWSLEYSWGDGEWMRSRQKHGAYDAPAAIYEVHLGSWMRCPEQDHRWLTYREIAPKLAEYVQRMGFTHVELLPVMEHPFYGSWGYQCTGYFAPTSRYGTPQDFMVLVDTLHQHGIGVILDWVPGHFPNDEHGLGLFDGTHLYEHPDPRRGIHPEWGSYIFDFAREEAQSFLFSSAFFWAERYHVDGLRVDAVSSMLYLDYARKPGEWVPNKYGGNENIEVVQFLKRFNREVFAHYPHVQTYAEEATAWPMVSRPTYLGGLGFGYKWDMGWMNDTLAYFNQDPIYRKYHHNKLTFRPMYAFNENFVLPLSHDEVVHGKGSLLNKMPGTMKQKFANLRLLLGSHYTQPGKKLLFMGGEFGQGSEWNHDDALEWDLLSNPMHAGVQRWVQNLNQFYRAEPALYELDHHPDGFEWVDCLDNDNSVLSFLRKGRNHNEFLLVILNHTPIPRECYRVGVPCSGFWREALNSDAETYGGAGGGNYGGCEAQGVSDHHHPYSLELYLPPLACLVLKSPSA